ncbi:TonB family protein [Methylobacterium sp. ap11]|uniref:TonB family protein n=1 Tax=Methylobacterium sp. ap11 TaxID=1761799 RepID=UPI001FCD0611|nr:TonB family protein [Methylobacterium sp. ap11]
MTTDAPEPREPGTGLGAAFLVALALHAAGLFALTYWRSPATPPGENEITIDLAPDLAAVDVPNESKDSESTPTPTDVTPPTTVPTAEPPSDTVPVETPPPPDTKVEETPQETPVEPVPAEAVPMEKPPEPVTEAVQEPEEQVVTSTAQDAPATVVARPVTEPKPEPKPVPKPVAKPKPVERPKPVEKPKPVEAKKPPPKPTRDVKREAEQAAERRAEAARQRRAAASASRMNDSGASAAASANAARMWGAMVRGAIQGRARSVGAAGTATVRFTVSRSGRVLGASLAGSSGNGSIDAAAVAAASGSLPPAPPEFTGAQQSFTLPVRFN